MRRLQIGIAGVLTVLLLVGMGMQGNDWSAMTPRQLYFIVASLNRVGLSAEARMIAAEAVIQIESGVLLTIQPAPIESIR